MNMPYTPFVMQLNTCKVHFSNVQQKVVLNFSKSSKWKLFTPSFPNFPMTRTWRGRLTDAQKLAPVCPANHSTLHRCEHPCVQHPSTDIEGCIIGRPKPPLWGEWSYPQQAGRGHVLDGQILATDFSSYFGHLVVLHNYQVTCQVLQKYLWF